MWHIHLLKHPGIYYGIETHRFTRKYDKAKLQIMQYICRRYFTSQLYNDLSMCSVKPDETPLSIFINNILKIY